TAELSAMWRAGVFGFKCFLVPSGVDEFAHVTETDLHAAMPQLTALRAPLLVHAESPGPIEAAMAALRAPGEAGSEPAWRKYETWLQSRPPAAEEQAIALMLRLAREFGARVHIVHLSAASAL